MGHIQVKNVPEDLHDELRRRAASRHQSVREYLLELIRRDLARPTLEEWFDRVESREPLGRDVSAVEVLEAARREREEELVGVFEEGGS